MAEAQVPENLMQAAEKRGEAGKAVIDLIKRSGMDISIIPSLQRSLETMLSTYKDDHKLVIGAGNMLIKWLETKSDKANANDVPKLRNLIGEIELIVKRENKAAQRAAEEKSIDRQAKELLGMVPEKKVTEDEWAAGLRDSVSEKYNRVLERNKKSADDLLKDAEKMINAKKGVIEFGQVDDDYLSAVEELAQQLKPVRIGEGEGERIITRPDTPELEKRVKQEFGELLKIVGRNPEDFLNDVFGVASGRDELEFHKTPDQQTYNNAVMRYVQMVSEQLGKTNVQDAGAMVAAAMTSLEEGPAIAMKGFKKRPEPTVQQVAAPSETYTYDFHIGKENTGLRIVTNRPVKMLLAQDLSRVNLENAEDVRKALEPLGIVEVYNVNDKTRKDAITELAKRLYGLEPLQRAELAEVKPGKRKRARG